MLCNVDHPSRNSCVQLTFSQCNLYIHLKFSISQNFQSNSRNYSMEVLLILGFDACNIFCTVFMCCELGQRISNEFNDINGLIDQFQWYRFPNKIKRILPMTMTMAQKPVSIQCFGGFSCCRDTFKKVCAILGYFLCSQFDFDCHYILSKVLKSVYSYFMVLREFIKWSGQEILQICYEARLCFTICCFSKHFFS